MNYEVVIGLEVHVQLNTSTKIFCGCSTSFGAPANSHVCPVCMGQPGVLPVMNAAVLEKSITAGLALNCEIASYSKFDRKNYFYPDLPKGYQISQFEFPICLKGYIDIDKDDGSVKRIGITRAHMEEDAGKLIHAEGTNYSLVDLNRAGVPLLEVVSEPDMRSSEEAYLYLKSLKAIMKTVGVSDVNMEEGSLRCDANVSVRPFGQKEFGTKVEVKNMNSFSGVRKAIDYEVGRQIELIESGGKIVQETRLFDVKQNKTFSMRSKEEANDYRYFPEPDLPPLRVESARIDSIKNALPELPRPRRQRFTSDYKIAPMDAETLAEDRELADYFEAVVKCGGFEPKKASNWIMAEVLGILNEKGQLISDFAKTVPAANLAELLQMVEKGLISGKIAKDIFPDMLTGKKASAIVEAKGLKQESDSGALEAVIDKILAANPGEVEKFKAGNTKLMGFFVGEAMKATRGQANPKLLNEILKNRLG